MKSNLLKLSMLCSTLCITTSLFAVSGFAAEGKRKAAVDEFSGQGYGMAGCGVGSIVFGDKPGMIQIFAATTNDYFGQTFAITSGTSNCEAGDSDKRSASLFITANREVLAKEIARGNGESLAHLSEITGCDAKVFGHQLQQNYGKIFRLV